MAAFEHVSVLLAFVYALALTHLLSRVGILLTIRKRVKFSGLLALAMFNCVFLVFADWLSLWDLRTLQAWDVRTIMVQFTFAVLLFGLCSLVSPEVLNDAEIDLDAFYFEQRPLFYAVLTTVAVVALIDNAITHKAASVAQFFQEDIGSVIGLLPASLGLLVRARWAQWVAGLFFSFMMIYFLGIMGGALR